MGRRIWGNSGETPKRAHGSPEAHCTAQPLVVQPAWPDGIRRVARAKAGLPAESQDIQATGACDSQRDGCESESDGGSKRGIGRGTEGQRTG